MICWRELAVVSVLQLGEIIPEMGARDMIVERDYRTCLIMGAWYSAYHKMIMMQATNDDMIELLAKVIRKAWLGHTRARRVRTSAEAAVVLPSAAILRKAASHEGTLNVDDDYRTNGHASQASPISVSTRRFRVTAWSSHQKTGKNLETEPLQGQHDRCGGRHCKGKAS
jgi:hypothetical protein